MKVCAIQPPYPYKPEESEATLNWLIEELDRCDESMDLIVLPEYCNAPSRYTREEFLRCVNKLTAPLEEAVAKTAKRCRAIVAVNLAYPAGGKLRNTTLLYNREGEVAGRYYKQHLTENETRVKGLDNSYTFRYREPDVVEVDGIRFAFLTCYDFYFYENFSQLARKNVDIIIGASHQRGERQDVLETIGRFCAFAANAYLLRASVSMGEGEEVGGCSMLVAPDGKVLFNAKSQIGTFTESIDPKFKYIRSCGYGNPLVPNGQYIESGRTPWVYRPAGSFIIPDDDKLPYPRVCAHRGFNTVAPENSLPAFGAAVSLGAPEIELDLWVTKDGEIVVCHDGEVGRVSDGEGMISELTYQELLAFDFGCRFSPKFRGLKIPLFEEVLAKFSRQAIINIHIKSPGSGSYDEEAFRKIVDLIYKYDCPQHVYFMGLEPVLETAPTSANEINRCAGAGSKPREIVELAQKYKCHKVQFFKPHFNQHLIDGAHACGIKCNLFWADDPEEAVEFMKMGIDTILTNDYLTIARALERAGFLRR